MPQEVQSRKLISTPRVEEPHFSSPVPCCETLRQFNSMQRVERNLYWNMVQRAE